MNFPFYIAKRYLFSKKSHNIINIISGISVAGVTVGTLALIVVLSVFNGFEELVKSLFNTFNPDLIVTVREGKTFYTNDLPSERIKNIPGVVSFSEVVEENALLKYKTEQNIVTLKGVSEDYLVNNPLDSMLVDGNFILENNDYNYTVMGYLVAYNLGIKINDFSNPVQVYVPKRTKKRLTSIEQSFNSGSLIPSAVFSVQQEIDAKYVIVPLRFARKLLDYSKEVTSLEIRLDPTVDPDIIQKQVQQIAGDAFVVKNRFQQQELLYKIMKSEKWAIFIILSFILVIAVFNVVGSLLMLILDIKRIFLVEGLLISFSGAVLGLFLGYMLCILQLKYGFIKLGPDTSAFIIPYYPIKLYFADFVAVFTMVFFIGMIAAWFPVKQIADKYLKHRLSDNLKSQ